MIKIYEVTPKAIGKGSELTSTLYILNDENSKGIVKYSINTYTTQLLNDIAEFIRVDFEVIHSNDPDAIMALLKHEGYSFD